MHDSSSFNEKLIFVVGNSRSGTTMMGRILGDHHSVFTFHEIHFFEELVSSEKLNYSMTEDKARGLLSTLFSIQREGYFSKRNPQKFYIESDKILSSWSGKKERTPINLFQSYLLYESKKHDKDIPCDQTPRNLFYVREIFKHYPNAKVINMIRDPRDIVLSQKKKWKRRFLGAKNIPLREALRAWSNYHPYVISKLWNSSIKASNKFDGNDNFINIYFEDLLKNPEETIRNICDFAGIDYSPKMLHIPQIGSSTTEDRPDQTGINKSRASSWQNGGLSNTELRICQNVCSEYMIQHNYEIVAPININLGVVGSYLKLPFKMSLSFLMNFNRYRNLTESLKRRFG